MKKSILSSVLVLTLFGTAYADGLTLGTDSIANGNNSITTGKNSIAIGSGSVATGENLTGEKIQEILKENQEQLENINRLKNEIDLNEKTYAEKLEVWEKVDRSQKKIAENNKLLAETLNPELANLNNEYAQFKPEYDRIIEDMNERLDMISHLDFTLIGTDTESGLSGLASELKESVEEGYNFSLPESFYEDYIENYIEVQGNLQQDEYIYNQNKLSIKDQDNNIFVSLNGENYESINYSARTRKNFNSIDTIKSEYNSRNNGEALTESQYDARIKELDDNFENFKNRLEEGESQFISSEQKKEFIEMEKKKLEINKKVLLSKRLQQEFYDLEKEYGKDSPQAYAKLQERINTTNEFNQLAKEFETSYPKEKVDYIVGKTNLDEFKNHIDDVKNGNIEAKKQLEDQFNEAIKETTDRYDALNKEIKEKEKEISDIEREIAQLTPTEQELKDAEMVESVKKKLDADKQALADALESLKLNDLTDIGENAIAIGHETLTTGKNAIGMGTNALVTGENAVGIGKNVIVTGENAVALGAENTASGKNSIALGYSNVASAIGAIAIGSNAYATEENAIAIGVDSVADEESVVSFGNDKIKRKIINIADGEVKENSTDAINGGQLHKTNLAVKDLDTKYVNIDNRVTNNTKDITNIKNNVGDLVVGTEGLLVLNDAKDKIIINHDLGKDVNALDLAKEDGTARKITGVADGEVKENSTDAINGGQLHKTNLAVKDLDTKYVNIDNKVTDIDGRVTNNTTEITNIKNNMGGITSGTAGLFILNDAKDKIIINHDLGKDVNALDLAKEDGTARKITGIADGEVKENSTDAINGGQLHKTNLAVKDLDTKYVNIDNKVTDIDGRVTNNTTEITNIKNNMGGITSGTAGLFILNDAKDKIIINHDLGKDVNALDLAKEDGTARKITGVADGYLGKKSTDAINGGQFYASNEALAKYFGGGAYVDENGILVSPKYHLNGNTFDNVGESLKYLADNMGSNIVGGDSLLIVEGDEISIIDNEVTKVATKLNVGDRKITGVANGRVEKGSQEAINGGQLYEVNQQVNANTTQINLIKDSLSHYNNRIKYLEKKVHQNRKVASAGISSAIAMSSIPYSIDSSKVSLGLGVASYDGESAFALGFQGNMTDRSKFRIQFSYDSQNKVGVGAGMAIEF